MVPDVLKGVGDSHVKALEQLEIDSVLDLLTHYPRRYIDRTRQARLDELAVGEEATVLVRVEHVKGRPTRGRGRSRYIVEARVSDGTASIHCVWFNQRWRERQLSPGSEVVLFGRLDSYRGKLQMASPLVDLAGTETGRIVPLYPQSEKARITSQQIGRFVAEAVRRSSPRGFADPIPEDLRARLELAERSFAFTQIHCPDSFRDKDAARRRLAFDELLRVQTALARRKRYLESALAGIAHEPAGPLVERFHVGLPFELTTAQERVIAEIAGDLAASAPMHRLLQGDVGSGKTVVALTALLTAVQGGHQGALMAPTEVLAEQHHLSVRSLLDGIEVPDDSNLLGDRPLRVELLTNRTSQGERTRLLAGLAAGEVDLLVGTHALIQEGVAFASLGVVVIDEQHRFGVEQRAALRDQGGGDLVPDVLVMTATPIPRTAAMTVYGDLDVSVLDELPPGRTPIDTLWVRSAPDELDLQEIDVWAAVREEVASGRQAYVVCPLVEESEKLEVRSAEETFERLGGGELGGLRLGLLHGRLTSAEKGRVMDLFRSGSLDVLVATTVIEVGVDVPNATAMVVLDADRFGIAQLHQLRGRVGRGADRSRCFLVAAGESPESRTRLEALERTTDGFELAEVDLDLRGEGTIMGGRQTGRNDLKLASLGRDRELVELAREIAFEIVDADPTLADHPVLADEVDLLLGADETEFLLKG